MGLGMVESTVEFGLLNWWPIGVLPEMKVSGSGMYRVNV